MSHPELVAHRGYAFRYPENTLLAIKAAVDAGAKFVEFDVLLSSDEVPVLFHDRDCIRMCGRDKAIHNYSFNELKTFSVSETDKFGGQFADNRITSLTELVSYITTVPHVTVFVELKRQAMEAHGIDVMLEKILPLLEPIKNQAVIISYSIESLLASQQHSDYPVGAVFDYWSERNNELIQRLKPQYMFTDIHDLPKQGRLECAGSQLAVYECIDPKWADDVYQRGVNLVETFQITEMLAAFQK
ncbi:hypothetical protein MNBD_GAMMA21-2317 [hydrothermal vent metagenome]|uniref:GP-PDE domain-containing protein n=1 Tax=hydrothermal vent metagenome TaxID=652676 RepID=A0A3B1AA39_9ZZZZ